MGDNEFESLKLSRIDEDRHGQLELVLNDGRRFPISAQIWDSLQLSQEDPISAEQLATLEEESEYVRIRQKCLDLLAQREHSGLELKRKLLSRFPVNEHQIDRCLDEMKSRGFQNDERFARLFVESRLGKLKHGPFLILSELRNRGIAKELAQSVLEEQADSDFWLARVQQNLEELTISGKPRNRAKLGQKLFQRGFPRELIEEALTGSGLKSS